MREIGFFVWTVGDLLDAVVAVVVAIGLVVVYFANRKKV